MSYVLRTSAALLTVLIFIQQLPASPHHPVSYLLLSSAISNLIAYTQSLPIRGKRIPYITGPGALDPALVRIIVALFRFLIAFEMCFQHLLVLCGLSRIFTHPSLNLLIRSLVFLFRDGSLVTMHLIHFQIKEFTLGLVTAPSQS